MNSEKYQKLMNIGKNLQERMVIKKIIVESEGSTAASDPDKEDKNKKMEEAKKKIEGVVEKFINIAGDDFSFEKDNLIKDLLEITPLKINDLNKKFTTPVSARPAGPVDTTPAGSPKSPVAPAGDGEPKKGTDTATETGGNTISATDPKADSRFEKWRKGAASQLGKIGKSLGDKFRGSPGSKPQSADDKPGTAPGNTKRAQSGGTGGDASSAENEDREIIRGKEALSFIDKYGLEKMKKLMDDKKIDVRIIIL